MFSIFCTHRTSLNFIIINHLNLFIFNFALIIIIIFYLIFTLLNIILWKTIFILLMYCRLIFIILFLILLNLWIIQCRNFAIWNYLHIDFSKWYWSFIILWINTHSFKFLWWYLCFSTIIIIDFISKIMIAAFNTLIVLIIA